MYVYANSLQRTVATAQFFSNGAFPGCDVSVHHQDKMGEMDPTFNPIITDTSEAFNQQALAAMNAALGSLKLDASTNSWRRSSTTRIPPPARPTNTVT